MSKTVFRAIQTRYKGYNFRSRLEARWAVFFDHLGVRWEYEPEGFELGNGLRYLPDFWLPEWDLWLEVKPGPADKVALEKAGRLVGHGEKPVYIASGLPDAIGVLVYPDNNYWPVEVPALSYFGSDLRLMRIFPAFTDDDLQHRCKKMCLDQTVFDPVKADLPGQFSGKTQQALEAARSSRFEFGAKGAM